MQLWPWLGCNLSSFGCDLAVLPPLCGWVWQGHHSVCLRHCCCCCYCWCCCCLCWLPLPLLLLLLLPRGDFCNCCCFCCRCYCCRHFVAAAAAAVLAAPAVADGAAECGQYTKVTFWLRVKPKRQKCLATCWSFEVWVLCAMLLKFGQTSNLHKQLM